MREIHRLVASCTLPTGGSGPQPRHVPDKESNWQPFGLQASTHPTEPHQPGQDGLCNSLQNKMISLYLTVIGEAVVFAQASSASPGGAVVQGRETTELV